MAYQRAMWHSGLTYKKICEGCRTVVKYTDYSLDFRPWFPDGFVYCPTCNKPLRHSEGNAVDGIRRQVEVDLTGGCNYNAGQNTTAAANFCNVCGNRFTKPEEMFCNRCGAKRR